MAGRDFSKMAYQLKIELAWTKPVIWRRVLVPADILLPDLHQVIQVTMGWHDAHLHLFNDRIATYSAPNPHDPFGPDSADESNVPLHDLMRGEKASIIYDYDFGDGWSHKITLEKILPRDPAVRYPLCIGGARACPPEDCGGPPGYEMLLEVMANPKHPEHEDMCEWLGGEFDPAEFDLDIVNDELRESYP